MQTPRLELLFPTPVMVGDIELTKKELDFIKSSISDTIQNGDGATGQYSKDDHILNNPELKDLKDWALFHVKTYIKSIYKPKYEIEPYITQSWVLLSNKESSHQAHVHPNSLLSGVIYISTNDDDKITFYNDAPRMLTIETDEYDILNSSEWWLPAQENKIIIFPSYMSHSVNKVYGDKPRISLPFNTFVKGKLGGNGKYTELILD